MKFQEDQYKEEGELMLAMKEIRQREQDLKITKDEWFKAWMVGRMKKRKQIDGHKIPALWNVVKKGGDDVIKDFKEKFQEVRVEGKRTEASSVNYTSLSPGSHNLDSKYTKEELEALYMGTSSEARKRFQRSRSFQRGQFLDR